jgi:hypothetical protein
MSGSPCCDLSQLRGLCKTMVALDIPPLVDVATGDDPQGREDDLKRLVKQVTAQYRLSTGQLLPIGTEAELNFYRRYIPGGPADPGCLCAVGVTSRLARAGRTHFWLRYHKDTPSFRAVSERIMASRFASDAIGNGGHVWLPLRVSDDRSGAAIVAELADKIEEIRAVAAGAA